MWHKYVGIQDMGAECSEHSGPNQEGLYVAERVLELYPHSMVHLVLEKVALLDHVLIGGKVTKTSLERIKVMCAELIE